MIHSLLTQHLVQSKLFKYPSTESEAAGIDIVLLVLFKGAVNNNAACFALNTDQSLELNLPVFVAEAIGKLKV